MTDTFRKEYKKLSEPAVSLIMEIKNTAENLENLFNQVNNREMSVAKTNLETTIMWATKSVVLNDEKIGDTQ
jgi:hypothetical protein